MSLLSFRGDPGASWRLTEDPAGFTQQIANPVLWSEPREPANREFFRCRLEKGLDSRLDRVIMKIERSVPPRLASR